MNVYVLDSNFKRIGLCDDFKSIIWTTRYFTPGDFELYLPATDQNITLLSEDRYVVREKDISETDGKITMHNVMIIEKVQVTTSIEDGNYLTVTGRCLKSILARRIVWQQTTLSGRMEMAIRQVVNENAINPAITARKISQLQLGTSRGYTDTIEKQVTGDILSDFITEVCTAYGTGWDIFIAGNKFVFELYRGVDRSYNQKERPCVIFSQEFDNLLTTDYVYDKTNHKNVALVAGEGEGLARKTATVGNASGLARYELYVDSRNSSSNDGEITDAAYTQLLIEEGNEALSDDANNIVENIEGSVEANSTYILNQDYFLGDIVEVVNEYGIATTPRIIEIIENEDDTGSTVIPTFSTWEV